MDRCFNAHTHTHTHIHTHTHTHTHTYIYIYISIYIHIYILIQKTYAYIDTFQRRFGLREACPRTAQQGSPAWFSKGSPCFSAKARLARPCSASSVALRSPSMREGCPRMLISRTRLATERSSAHRSIRATSATGCPRGSTSCRKQTNP